MINTDIKAPKPFTEVLAKYETVFSDEVRNFFVDVEYEMVRVKKRPCNVYHLSSHTYDKQIEKVFEDGLVFLPVLRSKVYSGFSHTHFPTDKLGPNTMVYGVIAQDLKTAKEFKEASLENTDHVKIGELLGYPKCCSEFFTNIWSVSHDPVFESALNTFEEKPKTNILKMENYNKDLRIDLRYVGIRVIPWFPCSLLCEESIKLTKVWLDVMYSLDEEKTEKVLEYLHEIPSKWSLLHGQIDIIHPKFKVMAGGYCDQKYKEVTFL